MLRKGVKNRMILNRARRQRWGDREVRDYEKAMKAWHEKYFGEAQVTGFYSEEAMANEPVDPTTKLRKRHAE